MGGQLPDCTIEDPGFRHFCGLHAWAGHPRLSGGGNALYRAISAFGGGCLRRNEQSYRSSIDQPVLYLCAPRGGVARSEERRVGKESGRSCQSRGLADLLKKKKQQ